MNINICIIYTHHKLGDLIWQLPYIKAISDHHRCSVDLVLRKKTQAKNILKDLHHINKISYNDFRKGFYYWIDVIKLIKIFSQNKYSHTTRKKSLAQSVNNCSLIFLSFFFLLYFLKNHPKNKILIIFFFILSSNIFFVFCFLFSCFLVFTQYILWYVYCFNLSWCIRTCLSVMSPTRPR